MLMKGKQQYLKLEFGPICSKSDLVVRAPFAVVGARAP